MDAGFAVHAGEHASMGRILGVAVIDAGEHVVAEYARTSAWRPRRLILVTGAPGEVGGEVVRHLVTAGQNCSACARYGQGGKLLPVVEVARGDLMRPETLDPALDGATKAFLMAGAQELPSIARHFVPAAKRASSRSTWCCSRARQS